MRKVMKHSVNRSVHMRVCFRVAVAACAATAPLQQCKTLTRTGLPQVYDTPSEQEQAVLAYREQMPWFTVSVKDLDDSRADVQVQVKAPH